ncbi:MAG: cation diffusion facilitator family transporter [Burkholderiaceae bacterium]
MSASDHGSTRAIFLALSANGGIAIAKFVAAILTGSNSMLAEAIHSVADCTNQLFLLRGMKEAQKPADTSHPMGYGRVVYFWAMMVALLLFFVGGAFSVMQGIDHLRHPAPLEDIAIALVVLGLSAALEAFSLRGALHEIRKISGGMSFFKWFRESRHSELIVVAGEDIAALAGLLLAFVAVLLAVVTGDPSWDAWGSIGVGILLMIAALFVIREIKAMIIGESAAPPMRAAIRRHIAERPEVEQVINLITLQWGGDLMVAVQAQMRAQPNDRSLVDAINDVEESLQTTWPQIRWCFFEPDLVNESDRH